MEATQLLEYALQVCNTLHYANTPMQYTAIFPGCKIVNFQMFFFFLNLIFAQTLIVGTR